jgi:hypothetical protein
MQNLTRTGHKDLYILQRKRGNVVSSLPVSIYISGPTEPKTPVLGHRMCAEAHGQQGRVDFEKQSKF